MTDQKRPLKVFLCHAHADRNPVRALYTRLTDDGVDAWLDKEKLLPGQDWELEIKKAVRAADVVVVCLSKQFNQAGFRQKEVRLALDTAMEKPEGEIFIIPARLEECDNLESLRKWHWVDLFEENGYEMLLRALRARADRIGARLRIKKQWRLNTSPSIHREDGYKTAGVFQKKISAVISLMADFVRLRKPIDIKLLFKANKSLVASWIGLAAVIIILMFFSSVLKAASSVPFSVRDGSGVTIYLYDGRDTASLVQASPNVKNWGAALGENGELFFTSNRDGKAEIYRLVDETPVRVTHTPGKYESWSPVMMSGKEVFFASNRDGKVEIYRLIDGEVERVTHTPGTYESWSPSVRRNGEVYFTSNRDGKTEIYRLVDGKTERVTHTPGRYESWSPSVYGLMDLYFVSNRDGKIDIYRLVDGVTERVTNSPKDSQSWGPIVRGGSVYFTSNRSSQSQVYLLLPEPIAISDRTSWTKKIYDKYPEN